MQGQTMRGHGLADIDVLYRGIDPRALNFPGKYALEARNPDINVKSWQCRLIHNDYED